MEGGSRGESGPCLLRLLTFLVTESPQFLSLFLFSSSALEPPCASLFPCSYLCCLSVYTHAVVGEWRSEGQCVWLFYTVCLYMCGRDELSKSEVGIKCLYLVNGSLAAPSLPF